MVAAGFSGGEADALRRAMAAWKRQGGLSHFRDKLLRGMRERGHDEAFAERLFAQIQGFGEYGFPESHAASFAVLVYCSAWLKRHEPAAFYAGLLNSLPMGFYSADQLLQDARLASKSAPWMCKLATGTTPWSLAPKALPGQRGQGPGIMTTPPPRRRCAWDSGKSGLRRDSIERLIQAREAGGLQKPSGIGAGPSSTPRPPLPGPRGCAPDPERPPAPKPLGSSGAAARRPSWGTAPRDEVNLAPRAWRSRSGRTTRI